MTPLFFVIGVLPITTGRSDKVYPNVATSAEIESPECRHCVKRPMPGWIHGNDLYRGGGCS